MPSELQRITQALLATLDQVPQVVAHLQRAATWCRQQIAVIHHTFGATHRDGQDLVLLLDHAARRCDEAAHALALAPPTARARAQNLADTPPPAPRPLTDTPPPPTPSRTRPPAAGPDPHLPTTGTDPPAEQTVVDLSTDESGNLLARIFQGLQQAASVDASSIRLNVTGLGSGTDFFLEIIESNGSSTSLTLERSVARDCVRLRESMYRPGAGTWYSARFTIDPEGVCEVQYDYEAYSHA